MTTERNKRMIFSLRMESNHAPPAFRADILTTLLERIVEIRFVQSYVRRGTLRTTDGY